jgi:hypothetical protein
MSSNKNNPEEEEIQIRRREVDVLVELGKYRKQKIITFWSETIPPETIFIWSDEWTPEKEKELIEKRIKEISAEERGTLKIKRV